MPHGSTARVTILPSLHRQVLAINRVEKLLRKVSRALDKAKIPYAVVGGNAVAAWVATVDEDAVRATKDVDVLVRRPDLAAIIDALRPCGLMHVEVMGIHRFVDRRRPSPKSGVHLLFAGEKVRPEYVHSAPDPASASRGTAGVMVIDLPGLVLMKLQANRDIDRAHLRDMLSVGLITQPIVAGLPADMRPRLQQIRATE